MAAYYKDTRNLVLVWLLRKGIAMKRKIIIICICVIVVAVGIILKIDANSEKENSKPEKSTKTIEKNIDDRAEKLQKALEVDDADDVAIEGIDKDIEAQNFSSLKYAAYTDEGFYVYNNTTFVLSFVDKKTCKIVPLCSKPDCFHDDVDCDAFYYSFWGVFVYDKQIYVVADDMVTSSICLYRINKDGSERTLIKTLFARENESGYSFYVALHKGCLYMEVDTVDGNLETEDDSILYCFALDSKDRKEILRHSGYSSSISIVNFDGDNIYIKKFNRDGPGAVANEVEKHYCYNINDGTITDVNIPEGHWLTCCFNGKISTGLYEDDTTTHAVKKYQVYLSDGENSECVYTNENFVFSGMYIDSSYQYIMMTKDEKDYLIVLSHDGKEVYQTEAQGYSMVWSDKEKVLLINHMTGKYALCDIKTGEIKEVCAR